MNGIHAFQALKPMQNRKKGSLPARQSRSVGPIGRRSSSPIVKLRDGANSPAAARRQIDRPRYQQSRASPHSPFSQKASQNMKNHVATPFGPCACSKVSTLVDVGRRHHCSETRPDRGTQQEQIAVISATRTVDFFYVSDFASVAYA